MKFPPDTTGIIMSPSILSLKADEEGLSNTCPPTSLCRSSSLWKVGLVEHGRLLPVGDAVGDVSVGAAPRVARRQRGAAAASLGQPEAAGGREVTCGQIRHFYHCYDACSLFPTGGVRKTDAIFPASGQGEGGIAVDFSNLLAVHANQILIVHFPIHRMMKLYF